AVNVRFDATGRGTVRTFVGLRRAATDVNPTVGAANCGDPNWNGPVGIDYRVAEDLHGSAFEAVYVRMRDSGGTSVDTLDMCFTPMGRTFSRTNFANTFAPLTDVYTTRVFRSADGSTVEG